MYHGKDARLQTCVLTGWHVAIWLSSRYWPVDVLCVSTCRQNIGGSLMAKCQDRCLEFSIRDVETHEEFHNRRCVARTAFFGEPQHAGTMSHAASQC